MATHSAKRKQLILLLALVLLGLVALIAWMEYEPQTSTVQNLQSVNNISIKRDGFEDIEITRSNDTWQMNMPYSLAANPQRIEPLLSLGTAKLDSYEKAEVDLVATGLTNPTATLSVGDRTFLLGKTDIDGQRRYSLVDDKVSLLPEWVWSLVHGGVSAFADLTVFTTSDETFGDSLYLLNETESLTLTNAEQWRALQADKITAAPTNTDEALEQWTLSSTETANQNSVLAKILLFDDLTLIVTDDEFAYAISNDKLNSLFGR